MSQIKAAIIDTISSIEQTTTYFYQQKNQEGFSLLNDLMNKLIQATNIILTYKSDQMAAIREVEWNTLLVNAMKAMEEKDTILLSDILIYDIKGFLEEIIKEIDNVK